MAYLLLSILYWKVVNTWAAAGHTSKEASLQSCLKEFFSQEEITWECPAEKQSKQKTRRKSLAEAASASPQSPATPKQQSSNGFARRTVSFSGKLHVAKLPGPSPSCLLPTETYSSNCVTARSHTCIYCDRPCAVACIHTANNG